MAASAWDVPGAGGDPADGGRLLLELEFAGGSLYLLRQEVAAHAAAAGLGQAQVRDVALAVNELASNAVRHGGGRGRLRMWGQDGVVRCQVQDAGRAPRGRAGAGMDAARWPYEHGHGLWLVRLLADQMSVTSGPCQSLPVAAKFTTATPQAWYRTWFPTGTLSTSALSKLTGWYDMVVALPIDHAAPGRQPRRPCLRKRYL